MTDATFQQLLETLQDSIGENEVGHFEQDDLEHFREMFGLAADWLPEFLKLLEHSDSRLKVDHDGWVRSENKRPVGRIRFWLQS